MVFSSIIFLWFFLPIVLFFYFATNLIKNKKWRMNCKNGVLLIASLIFYAAGGIWYLAVMIVSIVGNYLLAIWIDKVDQKTTLTNQDVDANVSNVRMGGGYKRALLVLTIVFNLGILIYFKYTNFFVKIIENIVHANFGLQEVILPIGISFFTFQSMSYVVDVYLKKTPCQKNLFLLSLYVALFPQLIAGPIVKYNTIEQQLLERTETIEKFLAGVRRFIYGLAKKVIIANTVGEVAENIFSMDIYSIGTQMAWVAILCYTIQIYFDFSGYSDMAIGLCKMFGFELMENFNYPYLATSVRDFWRRWHISLSSWFKEYVYIPLGGNRKGKIRTYINLFIVFLLTGIWHGANYTFIVWGVVYGVIMVIERLFWGKVLDKNKIKVFNWLYTMLIVIFLWVFFRAPSLGYALRFIKRLLLWTPGTLELFKFIDLWQFIMLGIGILLSGPIQLCLRKLYVKIKNNQFLFWGEYAVQISLFLLSIVLIIENSFNPFIYFQF